MIHILDSRDSATHPYINEERTLEEALIHLFAAYLSVGGGLESWSRTKLVVRVKNTRSINTVTYEGSHEDIDVLLEAVTLVGLIRNQLLLDFEDRALGINQPVSRPTLGDGERIVGAVGTTEPSYSAIINMATGSPETAAHIFRNRVGEDRLAAAIIKLREAGAETGQKFNDELLLELLGLEAPISA